MSPDSEIIFERRGTAGLITLNRPQALNAVTHDMVRSLARQLAEWADEPSVLRVIVTAAGGRAFSAGGDLRSLYELGRAGRYEEALAFWRDEYRLNVFIKRYRKPYVALIDGLVMGGGVGVSVHGSHRVAGDGFRFAMPEVGIGFFPDVGATWFLPRLEGELGTYCALTGDRLDAVDASCSGIATHRVQSSALPDLLEALCTAVSVDAILGAFRQPADDGTVTRQRYAINRLFRADRIEDILTALDAEKEAADFARSAATAIRGKSPLSLKIALAQLRRGGGLDFDECMRMEFRVVSRVVRGHDFYEGIRAVIVDKDQAPQWRPPTLAAISDAEVDRHFAPIEDELVLP